MSQLNKQYSRKSKILSLSLSVLRLMVLQMPVFLAGWWLPTAWVRWWPRPFLGSGPITGAAESRWSAPYSSMSRLTSTTRT